MSNLKAKLSGGPWDGLEFSISAEREEFIVRDAFGNAHRYAPKLHDRRAWEHDPKWTLHASSEPEP